MSDDTEPKAQHTARPGYLMPRTKPSGRRPAGVGQSAGGWPCRILALAKWHNLLVCLLVAAITGSTGFADITSDRMLLPIEVLGANGTTVSRTVALQATQAES